MPTVGLQSRFVQRANAGRPKGRRSKFDYTRDFAKALARTRGSALSPHVLNDEHSGHEVNVTDGLDVEISAPGLRLLNREAKHLAGIPDEPGAYEAMTSEDKAKKIEKDREQYRDVIQRRIDRLTTRWDREGKDPQGWNEDERNEADEDYQMKKYAKEQIQNADSTSDIIQRAELLIEEDWLGNTDALPGNLFCLGAFNELSPDSKESCCSWAYMKVLTKIFGCLLIIIIQIVGPPLIFISRMPKNIGVLDSQAYDWRCHPMFNRFFDPNDLAPCPGGLKPGEFGVFKDWHHIFNTRLLGVLFIIVFLLNAIFVIFKEQKAWKDVYNTFRYLDIVNTNFKMSGMWFLVAGAFVNCWVVVWSCMDMYVVCGASNSPQDLLMDALGLIFLYNLDDIGGDMAFLEEDDWPALRLQWIYDEMVHPTDDEIFDEDDMSKMTKRGQFCIHLYQGVTTFLMILLPVLPALAIATPFTQISPED